MPSKRRKHFVRPPDPGVLTREQALEIGRALFDAITADRLDELAEADDTTGDDHDGRPAGQDPDTPHQAAGP